MIVCPDCRTSLGTLSDLRCTNCGWQKEIVEGVHVYLSTNDHKSHLLESYRDNYELLARQNLEKSNLDRRYIRYQSMNLADYVPNLAGKNICDLGFGQGFLTRELLSRGASRITAVDISRIYLGEFARHESVLPIQANAERLPFVDEFDVIFCSDVMEHVLNLSSFLICLNQAIRSGGMVCVRVPYRENLMLYSPYVGCPYEFAHLRSFNRDLLRVYFKSTGFSIVRMGLDGFVLATPREIFRKHPLGQFAYRAFRRLARKWCRDEHEVTRWHSGLASLFLRPFEIVVMAQKLRTVVPNANRTYQLV
jgi:SAM-dependent methyltransferase